VSPLFAILCVLIKKDTMMTNRTVHYVGMSVAQYQRARLVFGGPAYYHQWMDDRVWTEVGDSDVVVVGDSTYRQWVWDASAVPAEYTN
jgi:hypothetical protein